MSDEPLGLVGAVFLWVLRAGVAAVLAGIAGWLVLRSRGRRG